MLYFGAFLSDKSACILVTCVCMYRTSIFFFFWLPASHEAVVSFSRPCIPLSATGCLGELPRKLCQGSLQQSDTVDQPRHSFFPLFTSGLSPTPGGICFALQVYLIFVLGVCLDKYDTAAEEDCLL